MSPPTPTSPHTVPTPNCFPRARSFLSLHTHLLSRPFFPSQLSLLYLPQELPRWLREQVKLGKAPLPSSAGAPRAALPLQDQPAVIGGIPADRVPLWLRERAKQRMAQGLPPFDEDTTGTTGGGKAEAAVPSVGGVQGEDLPPWLRAQLKAGALTVDETGRIVAPPQPAAAATMPQSAAGAAAAATGGGSREPDLYELEQRVRSLRGSAGRPTTSVDTDELQRRLDKLR